MATKDRNRFSLSKEIIRSLRLTKTPWNSWSATSKALTGAKPCSKSREHCNNGKWDDTPGMRPCNTGGLWVSKLLGIIDRLIV